MGRLWKNTRDAGLVSGRTDVLVMWACTVELEPDGSGMRETEEAKVGVCLMGVSTEEGLEAT